MRNKLRCCFKHSSRGSATSATSAALSGNDDNNNRLVSTPGSPEVPSSTQFRVHLMPLPDVQERRASLPRSLFKHWSRSSETPATSVPLSGDGDNNSGPASASGSPEVSPTSTPSSIHLMPSPDVQERPASALEHLPQPSITVSDATFPDAQQPTSPGPCPSIPIVEATFSEESNAVISPDPQQHPSPTHGSSVVATSLEYSNAITPRNSQQHLSPSPAKSAWDKAIEKLKPDDREEFNFNNIDQRNTIDDVLQIAKDKLKECEDKKWRYRKKNGDEVLLSDSVNRLLKTLASIGDAVVQHGPQIMSVPWAAIKFLLQVATNDIETMGNLFSDLEDISRILSRCTIFEGLYHQTDLISARDLINLLPDLYASMLTYLCHARRYFKGKTPLRFANSIVNSYATEFGPLIGEVKRLEIGVECAARVAAEEYTLTSLGPGNEKKLQEIFEKLEVVERLEILKWLSEVTYGEHHEFIRSSREVNTGDWLFKKSAFIEWENSSSSSIFWLHGIAGAGKTTLASMVIDRFKETMPKSHALAYFYCKLGENERQEPDSILRAIVQQLSIISPEGSLPKPVVSLYQKRKKDAMNSGKLRLDESKELILNLSKYFEQTVVIIDALDECNKETRYRLIDALMNLRSSDSLKIFVTSRNDDDILIQLKNEPEVYIQASDNSDDIGLFVHAEVDRYISQGKFLRGSLKPELKQAIVQTLINGASGMFLWVKLQIRHISREKSETGIREALEQLPKDLEATYSIIWKRISEDTPKNFLLAKKTMQWIMCAISPLTPDEILDAVTIKPMTWAAESNHDGIDAMTLLDVCQNLVVIDNELGVFRLAHSSVADFLQQKFTMTGSHLTAAEICFTLLCRENHVNGSHQRERDILGKHGLGNYVIKGHWGEHVRLSGGGSDILTDLKKEFFNSPAYYTWLLLASEVNDILKPQRNEGRLSPFWVVCHYQLWDMFENVIGSIADRSICNCEGVMPIHLIASHGYEAGLRLLLKHEGVDPNSKDNSGWTPLHYAARYGHEAVVKFLLEQGGVDPSSKDNYGWTPLHRAVRDGHETVEFPLGQGRVDPNSKQIEGWTPLHFAASFGHEAVVKFLLEHGGADPNSKDDYGRTPIHVAAGYGHEAVVKFLLEQGCVDPNSKDNHGWTPLHYAARDGNEAVIKFLLEQGGMDPNSKDNYGWTPLHRAARYGHEAVVKFLLEQGGVDPNSTNNHRSTSLNLAAEDGHGAVVKLLLQKQNVDLNLEDNDGETPLYCAAYKGQETVVKILLALENVDLNFKNNHGDSPVHVAVKLKHEKVITLLVGQECTNLNSRNNDGHTPLHYAAKNGDLAAVKLLLERQDVDLDPKDNDGNTPLHVAATNGHEEVVKLLEEAAISRGESTRRNS